MHAGEPLTGADGYEYPEGVWYTADGDLIGPRIWGSFAVIQEIWNGEDSHGTFVGVPGLGNW